MNFLSKWIRLDNIIQTEITQTKKKDKHIYNHLQVNVNQKVQDIYSALHRPLKLKENEDPNEHGSISLRRGIKA